MKPFIFLIVTMMMVTTISVASSFYISPNVPTDDPSTGSLTYLPWEVVLDDSDTYSVAIRLPNGTTIDAIHRMNGGDWLFSVEDAAELPLNGGVVFAPGDVVRFDGAMYSTFFNAAAAGVPSGSNLDAVFLYGGDAGTLVMSFDSPTSIGGNTYDPADLVQHSASTFSLFFDASATTPPIPTTSNVTGADVLTDGRILLTFNVPTTLSATTFLPGELVTWDAGARFLQYHFDSNWPLSSWNNAAGMLAAPGKVPTTLKVDKSGITQGDLTLTWVASCSVGDLYGIYEGTIGDWYSHDALECERVGLVEVVSPSPGNTYYIVVPHNQNTEGSYGKDSFASERDPGSPTVCSDTQELESCP